MGAYPSLFYPKPLFLPCKVKCDNRKLKVFKLEGDTYPVETPGYMKFEATSFTNEPLSSDAVRSLHLETRGIPDRVNLADMFEHYLFGEITGDQLADNPFFLLSGVQNKGAGI